MITTILIILTPFILLFQIIYYFETREDIKNTMLQYDKNYTDDPNNTYDLVRIYRVYKNHKEIKDEEKKRLMFTLILFAIFIVDLIALVVALLFTYNVI